MNRANDEPWYDLEYDRELIVQSIAKQYHVLPSEQEELSYSDWASLVSGLMEDTPLGQTVLIRKENDKERLKYFTKHEHRIRNEWRSFRANQKRENVSTQDAKLAMKELENMFREMFS